MTKKVFNDIKAGLEEAIAVVKGELIPATLVRGYRVVIEKAPNNYAAYVPDLPGCVATGDTFLEAVYNLGEAIDFHLDGMREDQNEQ